MHETQTSSTAPSKAGIWLKGAFAAAVKSIPYSIVLGGLGALVLFGGLWALGSIPATAAFATTLAENFGGFLYAEGAAATAVASTLNPIPIIALNMALNFVGGLLSGGQQAVQAYEQEQLHSEQEVRLRSLEGREKALEEAIYPSRTSRAAANLVEQGPRTQTSFAAAEATRAATRSTEPTLH